MCGLGWTGRTVLGWRCENQNVTPSNTSSASGSPAYAALSTRFARLYRLGHLGAIAGWDQAAMMPPKGNEARGAALAELQVLMHQTLTDTALPARLQAAAALQPLFLGSYFLSAALAMPLWLRAVRRLGLARSWGLGMLLAVLVFAGAALLGAGDSAAFALVCVLSGVTLGADLVVPAALLAGTIAAQGDRGQAEGAYFGWWNFASKLNLALAAGLALPALAWLGYSPGTQDPQALHMLTLAYCLLPCALKLLAATLLYFLLHRKHP